MKKQSLFILFAIYTTVLGCSSIDHNFANAVDGYTATILPEYKEYVQNDPNISEDSKRIRIQSAEKLQALVDEAKEK